MGQYKFSIALQWQLGLLLKYDRESNFIEIQFPFLQILFGLNNDAYGYIIFGIHN